MQIKADLSEALLGDTLAAIAAQSSGHDAARSGVQGCGGRSRQRSARSRDEGLRRGRVPQGVGVERLFRDARAAGVMAPTTDVLYDFLGKAVCGLPLF